MPKPKKTPRRKGSLKAKTISNPIKASSPRKAAKKRSHEFALTMRERISENWVDLKKKLK